MLSLEDWPLLKKHSDEAHTASTSTVVSMASNQEPAILEKESSEAMMCRVNRAMNNEDLRKESEMSKREDTASLSSQQELLRAAQLADESLRKAWEGSRHG